MKSFAGFMSGTLLVQTLPHGFDARQRFLAAVKENQIAKILITRVQYGRRQSSILHVAAFGFELSRDEISLLG